jgi:GNAT superfamily N-acetyltransferase
MAERHPTSPHWYLIALATEEDFRGQGLADRLLEDMLRRCDRSGHQAALETSIASN